MTTNGDRRHVAEITYPVLKGSETLKMYDDEMIAFGRGGTCQIRFGHAPVLDVSVPRLAGSFVAADNRLVVNSPNHDGHRALEVHIGRRKLQVPIGQGLSLDGQFDVIVRGEHKSWTLRVDVHPAPTQNLGHEFGDPSTAHFVLDLNEKQREVLRAYYEPILRGGHEPATHKEVAKALGYHPNTVRNKIYEIRELMYMHGMQMLDTTDARVAVVEAARVHGLFDE